MMKFIIGSFLAIFIIVATFACVKERPYFKGYMRRAFDAALTTCDPYNQGALHSCLVFSAAFKDNLYVYDATAGELVLAPNTYFPLKIPVGRLTDVLVSVVSEDKKFPFMMALDKYEAHSAIYPIRLFPSADKKILSFSESKAEAIEGTPFDIAAAEFDGRILAILSYPEESRIALIALKKETGEIDAGFTKQSINLGAKPKRVVIDSARRMAVIADEAEDNIHVVDLTNASDILSKDVRPKVSTINIGMPSDRIYLSRRDFGQGSQLYALLFKEAGSELKLVNIDKKEIEARLILDEFPMAGYFPDQNSASCCGKPDNKAWVSVVTNKGNLFYISIKSSSGIITLEKASTVDLTTESNLSLGKLNIIKILGGAIEQDATIDREQLCSSKRETFYISAYASSRTYLDSEPHEVEGHGISCEGEASVSPFGYKAR